MLNAGFNRLLFIIILALALAVTPQPSGLAQSSEQVKVSNIIARGNALLRANRFTEAIQQYQSALQIDPHCLVARDNIAEAHNSWGISFFKQHKIKEALAQFNKALEVSPGHANARRNIGICNQALSRDVNEAGSNDTRYGASAVSAGYNPLDGQPLENHKAATSPSGAQGDGVRQRPLLKNTDSSSSVPDASGFQAGQVAPIATESTAGATLLRPNSAALSGYEPTGANSTAGTTLLPNVSARRSNSSEPAQISAEYQQASTGSGQAPTTQTEAPATQSAVKNGAIDQALADIELKMYGQSQPDTNVMQRLERIERDISGQLQTGSIYDRINGLKRSLGL